MADPRSCTVLYKVVTPDTFNGLLSAPPSAAFTDDGISSLTACTSTRLPYVLDTLFPSLTSVWVLAILRNERIDGQLAWDDAEGCGRIEGGVDPWQEVALRRPVQKGVDGQWDFGELEW